MLVGGLYFVNHKTKDYFPEGAGLLNLSMSTLNILIWEYNLIINNNNQKLCIF